tara:strand:+ start:560 stop:1972 length:1413 start_codon:yes stop_codon:yes gene_type:complete
MSALLSLNPIPLISWKGSTFNQIYSSIQKNGQNLYTTDTQPRSYFSANPIKHYRREIASIDNALCSSKSSIKIDIVNRPNGTINNSTATIKGGLENLIDINLPNNTCETYENCSVILSPAQNARNRVRSSGMISRKFIEGKNNDTYYTSSAQYLTSRNRTFSQNQYNYIRQGDSTAKPGTSLASANVYAAQGINHCQKYHIVSGASFKYKWVNIIDGTGEVVPDETEYEVAIPTGYYALEDINRIFKQKMFENLHYLIKDQNSNTDNYYSSNISYAMQFAYNNNNDVFELQSYRVDAVAFPTANFTVPTNETSVATWSMPTDDGVYPQFIIENNVFKNAIGFAAASYPNDNTTSGDIYKVSLSTSTPGIKPLYVKLQYKPSNPQFAQQGGVSAGDLIARKKYNSITNSTAAYRNAVGLGSSVANALAYGVPSPGYTVKDKLGYPMKKTPTFSKYSDEMKKCSVTTFANAI